MNVTVKQINAFVALAQCRSFAEACERLHISQPALSIAIKNLEDSLNGSLFSRSTRSLHLTPEGEAFYPVAVRLLNDWDQALGDVVNSFNLKQGRLIIAAMPSFAVAKLPAILAKFKNQFPNINILIHDVLNESAIELVRQGRAELGICFNPGESEDLIFKELFSDELIAVVPQKHPLARKASTTWEALVDDTLIMLQKPSSMRLYIEEVLNEHQLQISPAIEVNQLATVGKLVALGLGVSTVPKMCEQQMIESGAVCVPLDTPKIERSVGVIWRTRFALSAAAKALHKQL